MKEIERKTLLYKTGVEYGDYTVNHALGCSHGCKYPCYAMMQKIRFGMIKNYEDWCKPRIVKNALKILDKELANQTLVKKIKSVQLCFTTDPFMYQYNEICSMSIEIIKRINNKGIKCTALTKGVLPQELADLSKENEYGITLVSLNEEFRHNIEPGSAPYKERISSLKYLHEKGCKTWVSIEPYPTPNFINQDINEILNGVGVDTGSQVNVIKVTENDMKNISTFSNFVFRLCEKFCEAFSNRKTPASAGVSLVENPLRGFPPVFCSLLRA